MNGYWIKSERAALSAALLMSHANFDGASDRAYFAIFNGLRALLQQTGVDVTTVRTSRKLRRLIWDHLEKPGVLDRSVGEALRRADDTRWTANHGDRIVTSEEASAIFADMKFVRAKINAVLPT